MPRGALCAVQSARWEPRINVTQRSGRMGNETLVERRSREVKRPRGSGAAIIRTLRMAADRSIARNECRSLRSQLHSHYYLRVLLLVQCSCAKKLGSERPKARVREAPESAVWRATQLNALRSATTALFLYTVNCAEESSRLRLESTRNARFARENGALSVSSGARCEPSTREKSDQNFTHSIKPPRLSTRRFDSPKRFRSFARSFCCCALCLRLALSRAPLSYAIARVRGPAPQTLSTRSHLNRARTLGVELHRAQRTIGDAAQRESAAQALCTRIYKYIKCVWCDSR